MIMHGRSRVTIVAGGGGRGRMNFIIQHVFPGLL